MVHELLNLETHSEALSPETLNSIKLLKKPDKKLIVIYKAQNLQAAFLSILINYINSFKICF